MTIEKKYNFCLLKTNNYILRNVMGINFLIPIHWKPSKIPSILKFDEVAVDVWNFLDKNIRFFDLLNVISNKYNVDIDNIFDDIFDFISILIELDALKINNDVFCREKFVIEDLNQVNSEDFLYNIIVDEFDNKFWPASLTWEVTHKCNLKCIHCYVGDRRICRKKELDINEISSLIHQASNSGCLQIIITGGEPFFRKDILDIILEIKKNGILYSVYTNGTLINEEIVDFFKKNPPIIIELSIYGATKEAYESISQVDGSYERFNRGLNLLIESGLNLRLKTVAMKNNFYEIEKMKQISQENNIDFRFDGLITPTIDGLFFPVKARLLPSQIVELEIKNNNLFEDTDSIFSNKAQKDFYFCGAGKYEANIDPVGKMSLCLVDRYPFYDLMSGSFNSGWKFVSNLRKKESPKKSKCLKCSLKGFCKICPGWLKIEKQKPSGIIDFLCNVSAERFVHFKKEA